MKKTLFLFSILMLFFSSCSSDDNFSGEGSNPDSSRIYWYGVQSSTGIRAKGLAANSKKWGSPMGITIKFINSPSNSEYI